MSFEQYDEEFTSLTKQVISKLSSKKIGAYGDDELQMLQDLLSQADDVLKQISMEARGVDDDDDIKSALLEKVQTHKAILANLRNECNTIKERIERYSLGLSSNNGSDNDNARPLTNNICLRSQNETLSNARSIIAETENVALDITRELGHQREIVSNTQNNVNEVGTTTDRAHKIIQSMTRRKESWFKFR